MFISDASIEVYTTRPDTLMGATYLVLAPEHGLVDDITTPEHREAVRRYREQVVGKSDMDRTGNGVNNGKTGAFPHYDILNIIYTYFSLLNRCFYWCLRSPPTDRRVFARLGRGLRVDFLRDRGDHGRPRT